MRQMDAALRNLCAVHDKGPRRTRAVSPPNCMEPTEPTGFGPPYAHVLKKQSDQKWECPQKKDRDTYRNPNEFGQVSHNGPAGS